MDERRGPGRPRHPDALTPAEWRVVEGVRHGLSNRQIAERQGTSLDAVKFHVGNALLKLDLASRKALRRWERVRRDSRLYEEEVKMGAELKLGALGQVSRRVKDVEAARRFYGEVLGLQHLYSFGDLAFFDLVGVRLFLSQGEGAAAESILYFSVEDVRSAYAALEARGVEVVSAPHRIHIHADGTEEWMAFFNDNEGRPLGIMSQTRGA